MKILSKGYVDEPIVVDSRDESIISGHKVFEALKLLSASKVPVLKVSTKNVRGSSKTSNLN